MSHTTLLFTDLYQLTMAEGYFKAGIHRRRACFDYFFRRCPFGGGYALFAGLGGLLEIIEKLHVSESDIDFLRSLGSFDERFLTHLKAFHFMGDIRSVTPASIGAMVETIEKHRCRDHAKRLSESLQAENSCDAAVALIEASALEVRKAG